MPRSILIVHPGALGDVLLAVPAMQRLRKKYAQHVIVLIAQATVARFLALCNQIDEWLSLEQSEVTDLFTGSVRADSRLTSYLQQCDEAVVWMKDEDHCIEKSLVSWGVRT